MDNIRVKDGFPGQIMHAIPVPLLKEAAMNTLVHDLYASMTGWFPPARHHYISRSKGLDAHILIYCVGGVGWFEIEGKHGMLNPNEALLIPRKTPHSYGADTKNPWSIHWAHFAGEASTYYVNTLPPYEFSINVSPNIKKPVVALFEDCYRCFESGYTQKNILLCSQALRHLLALLFFGNQSFSPGIPRRSHKSFDETIEYMRQHIDGSLTLDDMSKHAGLSSTRFTTSFKKNTGFSPVEYYIRLRIQTACRLFDTTALNVAEVAIQIGYDDPCYFSRIFKKVMNIPPSAYSRNSPL